MEGSCYLIFSTDALSASQNDPIHARPGLLLRLTRRIDQLKDRLWDRVKDRRAPHVVRSTDGIGKWGVAVLPVEISDITRFDSVPGAVARADHRLAFRVSPQAFRFCHLKCWKLCPGVRKIGMAYIPAFSTKHKSSTNCMRYLGFAFGLTLSATLLVGCYSTEGVMIDSMTENKDPYRFSCETSRSECLGDMKRSLVSNGFEIKEEDMDSGVFVVSKTLDEKEKISTSGFTELATGTESIGQTGEIAFLFTESEEGPVSIEMEGEVSIEVAESQSSETETQTSTASRGHPMMVRYGLMLDASNTMSLESPTAKKIQEER